MIRFLIKKYDERRSQTSSEITTQEKEKKPPCSHLQQQLSTTTVETREEGECQLCKQEKRHALIYRLKLMAALLLPFTLASLDLTIVASSTPFIASYFGAFILLSSNLLLLSTDTCICISIDKLDQLDWIVTAYTLTSTTFIPTFGQLADVFGRHAALQLSMGLMVVGSTLAAAAQTWGMLLLGRALQGTSAAGIMNIIVIVLSDKVSLEDNAKNNTLFTLVAAVSYSVGPVVGGYGPFFHFFKYQINKG
jgi:MFS family permease